MVFIHHFLGGGRKDFRLRIVGVKECNHVLAQSQDSQGKRWRCETLITHGHISWSSNSCPASPSKQSLSDKHTSCDWDWGRTRHANSADTFWRVSEKNTVCRQACGLLSSRSLFQVRQYKSLSLTGWISQFQTKACLQMFLKSPIVSESSWCFPCFF